MLRTKRFWVGLVISLAFLYLAFRGQDYRAIWEALQGANYWWMIPAVLVYFLAVLVRSWRWHHLVRPIKNVSPLRLFPTLVMGYMGNNLFPFRAGEVLRAYLLRRKEDISVSASLATIAVERVFDGLTMILIIVVVLPLIPSGEEFQRLLVVASAFFVGASLLFLILISFPSRTQALYRWLIGRIVPSRWRQQVSSIADRFLEGLSALRSGRQVAWVAGLSVIIWLLEAGKYYFIMFGFPFRQPFHVLLLTTAVATLATTIPSTPGYVGTFEVAGIETLKRFGVTSEVASSYTIVVHAALWFPITLLGIFFAVRESLTWGQIRNIGQSGAASEEVNP
jgi:uncharacterized protein (TIRG00374 family)